MTCLILTRSEGQAVRLGSDFYVTVKEIRRSEVLLRCSRLGEPIASLVRIPHCGTREVMAGVSITLRGRQGRHVRLAFEAPQDLLILRTELLNRETEK